LAILPNTTHVTLMQRIHVIVPMVNDFLDAKPLASAMVRAGEAPAYEAYAVRFATLPGCPLANLVKGADPKRTIDLAMTFWVLKDPGGRTVLVDAGFYREEILKSYGVAAGADFTRPDKALERLRIKPDEVTDVILTHMHSDHVDGADLFPKAQIWIQKEEYAQGACETQYPGARSSGRWGRPGDHTGSDGLHRRQAHIRVPVRGREHEGGDSGDRFG
jgi:glyoxylase-like metal-dependent hydrolase (beta-lactamase superfamily II)